MFVSFVYKEAWLFVPPFTFMNICPSDFYSICDKKTFVGFITVGQCNERRVCTSHYLTRQCHCKIHEVRFSKVLLSSLNNRHFRSISINHLSSENLCKIHSFMKQQRKWNATERKIFLTNVSVLCFSAASWTMF